MPIYESLEYRICYVYKIKNGEIGLGNIGTGKDRCFDLSQTSNIMTIGFVGEIG